MMRARFLWLFVAVAFLCALPRAASAEEGTAPPAKVQQLIDLLNDPDIRAIVAQKEAEAAAPEVSLVSRIAHLDALVRDRFSELRHAVPRIPGELEKVAQTVAADVEAGRSGTAVALVAALVAIGMLGERLVRRSMFGSSRGRTAPSAAPLGTPVPSALLAGEILPFLAFVLSSAAILLVFEWPPLLRRVVLTYLSAYLAFRVVTAAARLLTTSGHQRVATDASASPKDDGGRHRFWYRRICAFLAFFLFGWATVNLLPELGCASDVVRLVAYTLGLGLLALAIEAVWRRPGTGESRTPAGNALLTLFLGLLWFVWVAGFYGLLWLGIYAILLPPIIAATGRAAAALAARRRSDGLVATVTNVLVVRGVRAAVIGLAIAWLAYVWRFSIAAQSGGRRFEALVEGTLQGIAILLVADVFWQVCKAVIERQVQASDASQPAGDAARRSRVRTLLPLFRNTLAVFVAVVTALTVLSGLGVAIGPLIAGAGIFGVAIGFGSQTLVKDILSGVFFMIDDAFRVGEYIQSGSYKGTVESFSLRSVRLRHHRGPIFTVPFGDLGAVQNMSRDWVIDKMTINVTYDTDVDLARRLIKKVGQDLAADPEFAANTIEPLKMQGVESFGDFAIVLRMKLMTKPGGQFRIKRKAFVMIKKAFDENGVRIATPTVQVSGEEKGSGPAAGEAMRMRKKLEAEALVAQ